MATNLVDEKWEIVKFNFNFTNYMRLEISNLGRVRSFTKIEEGKILKGSVINGYRVISLKLYKPRDEKMQMHLSYLKQQITKLNSKITPVRTKLKLRKKKDLIYRQYKKEVQDADELLNLVKAKYRLKFTTDEKKRTIFHNPFIHRLVAEYFCRKSSAEHKLVIHLDYDKQNNHFNNLKWVTQEQATAHWNARPQPQKSKRIPFSSRSESSKGFKLNRTKVAIIKKRIAEGKSAVAIAKQFAISEMQVSRIRRGVNWGDVKTAG